MHVFVLALRKGSSRHCASAHRTFENARVHVAPTHALVMSMSLCNNMPNYNNNNYYSFSYSLPLTLIRILVLVFNLYGKTPLNLVLVLISVAQ